MHDTHGIYNVTLQVILANAFIIGGGMCYWYSHMASQSLLASEMWQNYTAF